MINTSRFIEYFLNHFVAIRVSYEQVDESDFISSFLFEVSQKWFLVTAGHCINEVREKVASGLLIKNTELIDHLGSEATNENPIPFPGLLESAWVVSDEFDYAVIELSTYFRNLISFNNVRPLNESVWKKQPASAEYFYLLGIPSEATISDDEYDSIKPTIIIVKQLETKPSGFANSQVPYFYGKIDLEEKLLSIKGMSGGPVFGFTEVEGGVKYWLIGLQSKWLPESQIIAATPTNLLGEFLESHLDTESSNVP